MWGGRIEANEPIDFGGRNGDVASAKATSVNVAHFWVEGLAVRVVP